MFTFAKQLKIYKSVFYEVRHRKKMHKPSKVSMKQTVRHNCSNYVANMLSKLIYLVGYDEVLKRGMTGIQRVPKKG